MAGVNGTTLQLVRELFKLMAGADMCRIKAPELHSSTKLKSSQF
jgi:hypothetical protein